MSAMAERLDEAARIAQRYRGTSFEDAAIAYLRAQIEQARKHDNGCLTCQARSETA